jgi:hypothetical protein
VTGQAYTFDHYAAIPDATDLVGKAFPNKATRVKAELWVSLPVTTLLNTSHSLDILEIMNGYIASVCKISSDVRRVLRPGWIWWRPSAIKNGRGHALRGAHLGHHNLPRDDPWSEGHQSPGKKHDADPGTIHSGKYRTLILIPFEIK